MRAFLFWPVVLITVLMLGITNLAPKLQANYQLNLQLTRRDQQILDLEAERQHLKKMIEIIKQNPDYQHKLQLQYLGVKPVEQQDKITKVAAKKSNAKKTKTKAEPEKVKYKNDEQELKSLLFKPVSTTRLEKPQEPWYLEMARWLSQGEVYYQIQGIGICLLGLSFAFLHPGRIPSLLEILYSAGQSFSSRYINRHHEIHEQE